MPIRNRERFAPTEQRFTLAEGRDAQTIYQQFAFLKGLFSGEAFATAVHQIIARPHRAWVEEEELRRPGQPLPMGSGIARQLNRAGPRVEWPAGPGRPPLPSLPAVLRVTRTEETLDTPENRFIKFALTRWRDFTADVERALAAEERGAPVRRGLREVHAVQERLDELLGSEIFDEVGRLAHFPAASQVLQKRAGYRDVYRAYVQFETAAQLTWDGGEDVYDAGKRDVATLYEFWVFLQLVKVLGRLCEREFDPSALFERRRDGMGVLLRRGRARGVKGSLARLGRQISIELWFNRTFSHRPGSDRASWTRPMRPDCSVLIRPEGAYGENDEVWVHFDAKYRVESLIGLFGENPATEKDETDALDREKQGKATAKRDDLLKMHAYRDAIRRSAGAYVIYPGKEPELRPMYHEILPGLGAFALTPTETGEGTGAAALYEFLDKVITHVATQSSQHERSRFWEREANQPQYGAIRSEAAPFLTRPPADTLVLLNWVHKRDRADWIHANRRCNLRGHPERRGSVELTSLELAVEFVLLYGPGIAGMELWRVDGPPELYSNQRMAATGYQEPQGPYFCLPLAEVAPGPWLEHLNPADLGAMRRNKKGWDNFGMPAVVTWLELLQWPAWDKR